jgi:hypothetical protein
MPAEQGAPQGGNPEEQLMAIAQDIVGQLGPEASAMVAEMILQLVQGGGGGAEAAPAEEAPVMARRGGRLMKRF